MSMDKATAAAWGRLQKTMRAGPAQPKPAQAEMFYPSARNDVRALYCAVDTLVWPWVPPRGMAAAAKRLAAHGMLIKDGKAYLVTAAGRAAASGNVQINQAQAGKLEAGQANATAAVS